MSTKTAAEHMIMDMTKNDFIEFPKIARLRRDALVTEKIDGTNACIYIDDYGMMLVGSRTRWITPENDNYGFARWAHDNAQELLKLGPGRHFGEWWGAGIQRTYGLKEKRLSLFNVQRWCLHGTEPGRIPTGDPRIVKFQDVLPACVGLVPVLWSGIFDTQAVNDAVWDLQKYGSKAAPGFKHAEGVVVYHVAAGVGFKQTIEKDDEWKGRSGATEYSRLDKATLITKWEENR